MHHNLIIKDGDTTKVAKEVLVDGIQFVDEKPTAGSTNPVTSDGVKTAIDDSVGDAAEAIQEQIDAISDRAGSGYIPKGPASVAILNGLTGQENGWIYTMTDVGTLTDGSLDVVAGDTVAWDATNSVWYKAMDYAPRQYGTNEVHNLPTSITAFRTGDVIPVDGPDGTAKMAKDDLLQITADNIVPKFTESTINIVNDFVSHNGKIYRCIQENAYVWRDERYVEAAYDDFVKSKTKELTKGQLEYLPFKRYFGELVWRNASVNVGTGAITSNSTRVTTAPKIYMAKGTKISFPTENSNLQYTILGFSADDYTPELVDISKRLYGGLSWESAEHFIVPTDSYVIIQCRYSDNSNISPSDSDVGEISAEFVVKFGTDNLSDDVVAKLNELGLNVVDLFLFAGQSNMAGRGATSADHPETAPTILTGAGYEYRAISYPTKLYPIAEPFGVNENKTGGISEPGAKTGSMVTSFVNAYYSATKTTVIGVSASKGGTRISEWKSNGVLLPDALQRLSDAVSFLTTNGYTIRHKYVLWCQGESDGDYLTNISDYKSDFNSVLTSFKSAGIEKMFIVRIGRINSGDHTQYDYIIDAQTEICQENKDVVMASTDFYSMQARGLMKDSYHYYQEGYNEVGNYAGVNVGAYVALGGKEQTMFDPKSNDLYFSHKN